MLMTWKDGRGFFPTQVGDEFLGDVHPAQQLLQEAEGKSFFNGGCVQFHVLKTPLWRGRDSQLRHRPYPTSHTFLVSLCTLPTCRSFLHRPLPHLRLFSESCFPMLLPLGLIGAPAFSTFAGPDFTASRGSAGCFQVYPFFGFLIALPPSQSLLLRPSGPACSCLGGGSRVHVPGYSIAIHLQKLQQLLGLLPVPCLLLGRERIVGDQ